MADEQGAVILDEEADEPSSYDIALQEAAEVAAVLMQQPKEEPVLWADDEHTETWVAWSTTDDGQMSHTVQIRAKPGSPAARHAELTAQAEQAHTVLTDPNATSEQIIEAARVAALASLAGITVT